MKLQNKWFIGAMLGAAVCLVSTSCVDEIKFGNSFLDKAPGGNATIDTVFNSAEYTRQFLNTCYSRQYYGLPYNTDSNGNIPDSSSPYLGKKDALTDCWSLYFSDATVYQQYYLGTEYQRQYTHWVYLRLSDIYLTYAEALLQAKNDHRGAIDQMNIVRARVGLKKDLAECVTDKNLLSDKAALLEELLCERVRELGLEDSRYFDLVRYKRADRFEKRLHGLLAYRLDDTGNRITGNAKWNEGDKNKGALQPTRFEYERFELSKPVRRWWTYGFDPKWYLSPFPQTEINKGYGLIQNPGW